MRCSPLSVNKDNNRQAAEDVHITLFIGCWRGQYARKVERPSLTALISLVSLSLNFDIRVPFRLVFFFLSFFSFQKKKNHEKINLRKKSRKINKPEMK
jgi:hypothetical protein